MRLFRSRQTVQMITLARVSQLSLSGPIRWVRQGPHISYRVWEAGTSRLFPKCSQICVTTRQKSSKWSVASIAAKQNMQVAVGSLLHLLLVRFSRVRILLSHAYHLKALTFLEHRPFQMVRLVCQRSHRQLKNCRRI